MNHIQQIISDLSNTSDDAKSATWQRLIIRAICALAQEVRRISNQMAWGAPGDIPPRVPAEAGEMARELDRALREATQEFYQGECLFPDEETCDGCSHGGHCIHMT